MSARYRVLVAGQELLDELRANPPVGWAIGESRPHRHPYAPADYHEVDVEDAHAPDDLEGLLVDPTLQRNYELDETSVQSYRVVHEPTPPPEVTP